MGILNWLKQAERQVDRDSTPDPDRPVSRLQGQVIDTLRTIYDPEIPVNIYDLGLIYDLKTDSSSGQVAIQMTLTAPGCPVAQTFPHTVAEAVLAITEVQEVKVELVWEPRWTKERMSEAARLELGLL